MFGDMDSPLKPTELVRSAAIARRYYIDGRSKSQIATEFAISRFKVARTLEFGLGEGGRAH